MKKYILLLSILTSFIFSQEVNDDIEEVVSIGQKAGLKSALKKQQDSDSIISVVDSDGLGQFPDTTAAEAVRRLSGISVENDQGEGRYIVIRGMSPELNSFAFNGAMLAAPENNRAVLLDGLSTDLLSSITVSKTLTPDQDADSIGGRIDFKTLNPLDIDGSYNRLKIESSWNELTESSNNPRMSFTTGRKVSSDFAYSVGMNYQSRQTIANNNETGFGWEPENNVWFMNDDYEQRYYDLTRQRLGFSGEMSFLINDSTQLYIRALHNDYQDDELRFKDEYGKLDMVSMGATSARYDRVRHDVETRQRIETRTLQAISFGGSTELDFRGNVFNVDFDYSYSFAEENDTDNADATFRCEIRADKDKCIDLDGVYDDWVAEIDWSNPQTPVFMWNPSVPGINAAYDLCNYVLDEVEFEKAVSEDTINAFKLDFTRDLVRFGFDATEKFGFKSSEREKNVQIDNSFWSGGDYTLANLNPTGPAIWRLPNPFFTSAGPSAVRNLENLLDTMEISEDSSRYASFAEDFITNEDVTSIYYMNTFRGEVATIILGFRYEITDTETLGNDASLNEDGVGGYVCAGSFADDVCVVPQIASGRHEFFAPNFTYKLQLDDNLIFRAARWSALSRPKFTASAFRTMVEIEEDDGEIDEAKAEVGNPNLKPMEATNYDFGLEYYFSDFSYVGINFFTKYIKNDVYKVLREDVSYQGIMLDEYVSYVNADEGELNGMEINFQYELENLPGFFVSANYTSTEGENESPFDRTERIPFRKLSEQNANLSFGYDKGKFDVRLAANYRSDYLDVLSQDEDASLNSLDYSRFTDNFMQVDFTAKYRYSDQLTFNFELVNINDEPEYYYWGDKTRLSQYDEYGSTVNFGARYSF